MLKTAPTFLFATVIGLAACATADPAVPRHFTTHDLGEVTDDAIGAARLWGVNRVLLVLDIDNTLLAMEQGLGSDQWYEWQSELARDRPCAPDTVADRFAVQGALYFASAMRPTQPDAAERVAEAQDTGIPIIALTSRGVDYRLQTFRELRRNGMDFSRSALGRQADSRELVPAGASRPVRYEDGVFLTTGQHKGMMLKALLDMTEARLPRVIVMADDKQANLDAVIEIFSPLGVELRAWRYQGEDENVSAFDPVAAARLWRRLEPALRTIQNLLGPDNYQLPTPDAAHPACDG